MNRQTMVGDLPIIAVSSALTGFRLLPTTYEELVYYELQARLGGGRAVQETGQTRVTKGQDTSHSIFCG